MNTLLWVIVVIVALRFLNTYFNKKKQTYANMLKLDEKEFQQILLLRINTNREKLLSEMTEHEKQTGSFSRVVIPDEMLKLVPEGQVLFRDVFKQERQKRACELLNDLDKKAAPHGLKDSSSQTNLISHAILSKATLDWAQIQKSKVQRAKQFPIWRSITLGLHKDTDAYRDALNKPPISVTNDALDGVVVSAVEIDVDLVNISVADLGFKNGAYYKDICARAVEMGLNLCPAEVGPALRLSYTDQINGEHLQIATETIINSKGNSDAQRYVEAATANKVDAAGRRNTFALTNGGGTLLVFDLYSYPELFYNANSRFVFVRHSSDEKIKS